MKINITLKEKHIAFCTNLLLTAQLGKYGNLAYEIRSKVKGMNYLPDDMVSMEISASDFVDVYTWLGHLREGIATVINGEMKELLLPQLMAKMQLPDVNGEAPEEKQAATEALASIQAITAINQAETERQIQKGRDWLAGLPV
jgi:hypothetical protein